jgi:hypothetical protein
MAKAKLVDEQPDPMAAMQEASESWEWDTVREQSAALVLFDTIGDQFVGQYLGEEHITPENAAEDGSDSFDRFVFKGPNGVRYAVNKSYTLVQAMKEVAPHAWVRITYAQEIPTKRNLQPMKDFVVDVRRT